MVYHITGASGYFGGNFVYHNKELLKKTGCVLYDLKDLPNELKDFEDVFIKGDINETLRGFTCFKPGDILINFASFSHVDFSFKWSALTYKNNQFIGELIKDISKKYPFLFIVHISTDEVMTRTSPYSDSKYKQELTIRAAAKNSDRVIILRFNNLYGNNEAYPVIQQQPCLIPNTIKRRCIIKQGNTATNTRNFMFIGDAINYVKKYSDKLQSERYLSKIYELYYGREYTVSQIHIFLINLFEKHTISYDVKEIPDREVNDTCYPSFGVFDEDEETFKKHLEETFEFIIRHTITKV